MSRASICVSRITSALRPRRAPRRWPANACSARRRHLLGQALEGPVAAAHHLGRDVGQRDDRADRLALAGELERRDVALDAVVVGGERRGLGELDRAVLADEAAAGAGGQRGGDEHGRRGREGDGQATEAGGGGHRWLLGSGMALRRPARARLVPERAPPARPTIRRGLRDDDAAGAAGGRRLLGPGPAVPVGRALRRPDRGPGPPGRRRHGGGSLPRALAARLLHPARRRRPADPLRGHPLARRALVLHPAASWPARRRSA